MGVQDITDLGKDPRTLRWGWRVVSQRKSCLQERKLKRREFKKDLNELDVNASLASKAEACLESFNNVRSSLVCAMATFYYQPPSVCHWITKLRSWSRGDWRICHFYEVWNWRKPVTLASASCIVVLTLGRNPTWSGRIGGCLFENDAILQSGSFNWEFVLVRACPEVLH